MPPITTARTHLSSPKYTPTLHNHTPTQQSPQKSSELTNPIHQNAATPLTHKPQSPKRQRRRRNPQIPAITASTLFLCFAGKHHLGQQARWRSKEETREALEEKNEKEKNIRKKRSRRERER